MIVKSPTIFLLLITNTVALSQEKSKTVSGDKDIDVVEKNDTVRLYYKDGTPFSDITYERNIPRYPYYSFDYGLMLVKKNGKTGYLNTQGEIAVPMEYDWGRPFESGRAVVFKNRKGGVVDKNNNVMVPFIYDEIAA